MTAALGLLAARDRATLDGQIGRNVDDPDAVGAQHPWANVGAYRRALSSYDVKVAAVPLLSRAVDEPCAYESVGAGGGRLNVAASTRSIG